MSQTLRPRRDESRRTDNWPGQALRRYMTPSLRKRSTTRRLPKPTAILMQSCPSASCRYGSLGVSPQETDLKIGGKCRLRRKCLLRRHITVSLEVGPCSPPPAVRRRSGTCGCGGGMKGPETGREVQDWTKRRRLSNVSHSAMEAWKVPRGRNGWIRPVVAGRAPQNWTTSAGVKPSLRLMTPDGDARRVAHEDVDRHKQQRYRRSERNCRPMRSQRLQLPQ